MNQKFKYEMKLGELDCGLPKKIIGRVLQYYDTPEKCLDLRVYIQNFNYTRAGIVIPEKYLPAFFKFVDEIKMKLYKTEVTNGGETKVR